MVGSSTYAQKEKAYKMTKKGKGRQYKCIEREVNKMKKKGIGSRMKEKVYDDKERQVVVVQLHRKTKSIR